MRNENIYLITLWQKWRDSGKGK